MINCTTDHQTPILKQEKNEVWTVKEENGEFSKDKITYLETYEFDEKGNEIGHLIYDTNGDLSGKDLAVFDDQNVKPIGSKYFTANDSLLSYYQFDYNDKGEKISRKGYDASNDELLRIETFSYDENGNMILKEVKNAKGELISSFAFTYDDHHNKISMTSKDGAGNVRVSEEYRLTKFDEEKRWLENWGWRDNKPTTYRVRELTFYN